MDQPNHPVALKLKSWVTKGEKRFAPGTVLPDNEIDDATAIQMLEDDRAILVDAEGRECCWRCMKHKGERLCSVECFVKAGHDAKDFGAHVSAWEKKALAGLPRRAPLGAVAPTPEVAVTTTDTASTAQPPQAPVKTEDAPKTDAAPATAAQTELLKTETTPAADTTASSADTTVEGAAKGRRGRAEK